jgi:putative phosphoesterase
MISEQSQVLSRLPAYGSSKIVGLISDTHIPVRARSLPKQIFKIFENADFIVHAGDLVNLSVIDELEQIAPVLAVYGNMDESDVKESLPRLNSLKMFNWKIGVMHNPGVYFGIGKMRAIAEQNGFDVLVHGHTHNSNIKWDGNILYINPGSPTNPVPPFIVRPSVALLKVTKQNITPEIIQL